MFNFRWSSTSVSVFGCWLLAHLTHDLSQAEKKMDVVTISLKIDKDVILIEKSCHFVCCSSSNNSYFSQLKIRHVLNGPTAKNQQRCCLPGYIAYPYFPRKTMIPRISKITHFCLRTQNLNNRICILFFHSDVSNVYLLGLSKLQSYRVNIIDKTMTT